MRSFAFLAISLLVSMASGQASRDYEEPFQNPGEIFPGLTIKFLINAGGGILQQDRVIDSMAYACRGVLPVVGSVISEVDLSSLYWGSICDGVIEASEDLDAFDATRFCNDIIAVISGIISQGSGGRYRRQAEYMEDPLGIIEILTNITRDLYGIDVNVMINDTSTINTICTNVKENFLRPSFQDVISQFGAELMSTLLPQICRNWQGFLANLNIDSSSPFYNIIQEGTRIGSQAGGYDDRVDLCQNLEQALSAQGDNNAARKTFSMDIISKIFAIMEEADTCSPLANDVIDDVIQPLIRLDVPGFVISDDVILTYTGIDGGIGAVCRAIENAVTYEIDLQDPVPVQLIPGTTLTVEFFLNAAGGIWQQDRLIDSLAFVCTDVLPDLELMVPEFESYVQDSWDYKPVCRRIREAARNLGAFDATEICNGLTKIVSDLIYGETGERIRRQVDPSMQDPLGILKVLADVTKDLYNIDINDPSSICPNIAQFLNRSTPDIISEFGAKLMVVYLPETAPICQGWNQTLESFGIDSCSPFYHVVQNGARIVSQAVGYGSRQALCREIDRVLAITGDDNEERKTFARNIIESSFEIYTNNDRCSMYVNDAIDDIIEPILEIKNLQIKISDYTIYRYTGYMGVEGVCEAIETAFTKLSTSTVTMTLTGESFNGEILVYTDDLKNLASPRFKELEKLYCAVIGNYLRRELESDLRSLDCVATSFSPGSIIAKLEIEIQAYTQDVADSLAQGAVDLSTSGTFILSSDGDTLTVSSLQGSAGRGSGLATGAIIGIAIAAAVVVTLLVFIIIYVLQSGGKGRRDAERGVGMRNPPFSKDEQPYSE